MSNPAAGAPPAVVRYGWVPLAVLAATNVLQSGEGQSLSQAVKGIESSFHVSDAVVGWIPAAMIMLGVAGSFVVGLLADRTRRTLVVTVATVTWTLCMGLTGFATSFVLLFLARLLVGSLESTGPASVSLISDYFPVGSRARSMGLWLSGAIVGSLVGLGGGGLLVGAFGWRWAFWMWVPLGAVVAVWLLALPEPARGSQDHSWAVGRRAPAAPGGGLGLGYSPAKLRTAFGQLARVPSLWCGLAGLTVSGLLLNSLAFWGVQYFERGFGLTPAGAGGIAALAAIGAFIGLPGGGVLTDKLLRRGAVRARVYVTACSSAASGLVFLAAFLAPALALAAPLLLVGSLLLSAAIAPGEALLCDVVVAGLRGRGGSLRAAARSLAALGPPLTGLLAEHLGLRAALAAMAPVAVAGGAVVLMAARWYQDDVALVAAESLRNSSALGGAQALTTLGPAATTS